MPQDSQPRLKSHDFRREREAGWHQLEDLLATVEARGMAALSPQQLEQLPRLYRSALSSLAVARAIALDHGLLLYLENLGLRAFLCIYRPQAPLATLMVGFLGGALPRAVRALTRHLAAAALAMAVGGIAGFALTRSDEGWFSAIVPLSYAAGRGPQSSPAELEAVLFAPLPDLAQTLGAVANALFAHNTVIGLLCFALGFLAGLPTILLLLYQGMVLGAFVALHYDRGLTLDFVGWVSIHGVTEVLAILMCGAAGLALGDAVVFPGRHSRAETLALRGKVAAEVAAGAVLLFCLAALLEGVGRQAIADTTARLVLAAASAIGWTVYFGWAGRSSVDSRASTSVRPAAKS